jgi:hypothetical protein
MKPSPNLTPAGPLPPTGGVRVFGHTADIGLAVRGETLGDLFLWAAAGLARVALKTRAHYRPAPTLRPSSWPG